MAAMKRVSILFCLALALLTAQMAGAQAFNHLSLGLGGGTDGVGAELAVPLGGHVQLRAGYGMATGLAGYTYKQLSVPEHPGNTAGSQVTVPLNIKLGMRDARLLFNIHPGSNGFHLTLGAYLGDSRCLRTTLTDLPADYNTAGFDVDGYLVKATNGKLEASLDASGFGPHAFAIKPYLGVGYGYAVREDKRLSFSVDLGALYQGKPTLWAEGKSITGRTKLVQLSDEALGSFSGKINNYTRYAAFWPTLNLHLYVRLF